MSLHHSRLEELEIENEWLRGRLKQLEGEAEKAQVPLSYGLTGKENQVMLALLKSKSVPVPCEYIKSQVWGNRWMSEEILRVQICKIRAKLKPFGVEISRVWGHGYYLTPEMKAKVAQHLADESPREK